MIKEQIRFNFGRILFQQDELQLVVLLMLQICQFFFFFCFEGGCRLAMSEQMKKCMYRTLTKLLYTYN
jgi:hypothetical protein